MRITVSENVKDSKFIVTHEVFKKLQNKTKTASQLGFSRRSIGSFLKKPLPVIEKPVIIDIEGKTWRDIEKELILSMLELCEGNRAKACKRLGLCSRGLRLKRDDLGIGRSFKNAPLEIDVEKLMLAFREGHTLKELSDIFITSMFLITNRLQSNMSYSEYSKQIKENSYARSQRTYYRNQKKKLDSEQPIV